jgi:phosphatidylinositol alpha-mannosyltransferase
MQSVRNPPVRAPSVAPPSNGSGTVAGVLAESRDPKPGPSGQVRARVKRHRWLAGAVSVLVVAALVYLAIDKLNLAGVGHALAHVRLGWLILAPVLMCTAFVSRGESWFAVVRAAVPDAGLRRSEVQRALMIGMAGSTVAPGRVGEAARTLVIARRVQRPGAISLVLGTVLAQTFLNVIALSVLTAIAISGGTITAARISAITAVLAVPAALLALIVTAPHLLARLRVSESTRLGRWVRWTLRQAVELRSGLTAFRRVGPAVHATVFQFLAWALQLATCYTLLAALNLTPNTRLAAASAVLVAVNITAIIPLTPSNVGVFQAACIAVLAPFGVAASHGLAYGLVLQAVEVFSALAMGIPAVLREGLTWNDLRHIEGDSVSHGESAPSEPENEAESTPSEPESESTPSEPESESTPSQPERERVSAPTATPRSPVQRRVTRLPGSAQ